MLSVSQKPSRPTPLTKSQDDKYIGVITLQDLLYLFKRKHTPLHYAISSQYISSKVIASDLININLPIIFDDDTLERIAEIMSKFQTIVLPRAKERNKQICGLLYLKDIITEIRNLIRKIALKEDDDIDL